MRNVCWWQVEAVFFFSRVLWWLCCFTAICWIVRASQCKVFTVSTQSDPIVHSVTQTLSVTSWLLSCMRTCGLSVMCTSVYNATKHKKHKLNFFADIFTACTNCFSCRLLLAVGSPSCSSVDFLLICFFVAVGLSRVIQGLTQLCWGAQN